MNTKQWSFIVLIICFITSIILLERSLYKSYYTSKKIVNIFEEYSLTYDIDAKSVNDNFTIIDEKVSLGTCKDLIKKINYFVDNKKPIILTMVGFPYKSCNTKDKVLSSVADGAERYSLVYIHTFLEKIKRVYEPGAKLFIFTDGIVFCDIEHVADEVVVKYENDLKKLVQDLPHIEIITMQTLCSGKSPQEIRNLVSQMNPSEKDFNAMIDNDKKLQKDVMILTQRLAFELALLPLTPHDIAEIGLKETQRSLQYSNFLKTFRPEESIRCSVHYQQNPNNKIGLKLSDSCVTPWHGVLVETKGKFTIQHLKDINQNQYKKVFNTINGLEIGHLSLK